MSVYKALLDSDGMIIGNEALLLTDRDELQDMIVFRIDGELFVREVK